MNKQLTFGDVVRNTVTGDIAEFRDHLIDNRVSVLFNNTWTQWKEDDTIVIIPNADRLTPLVAQKYLSGVEKKLEVATTNIEKLQARPAFTIKELDAMSISLVGVCEHLMDIGHVSTANKVQALVSILASRGREGVKRNPRVGETTSYGANNG